MLGAPAPGSGRRTGTARTPVPPRQLGRAAGKDTACWYVGRFCQLIGGSVIPPSGDCTIVSAHHWSPAPQVESPGYTVVAGVEAAWRKESRSTCRHEARLPPPQYACGSPPATGSPSTVRRSLSTYPHQPDWNDEPWCVCPVLGDSSTVRVDAS